jgi:hypothetical protein
VRKLCLSALLQAARGTTRDIGGVGAMCVSSTRAFAALVRALAARGRSRSAIGLGVMQRLQCHPIGASPRYWSASQHLDAVQRCHRHSAHVHAMRTQAQCMA